MSAFGGGWQHRDYGGSCAFNVRIADVTGRAGTDSPMAVRVADGVNAASVNATRLYTRPTHALVTIAAIAVGAAHWFVLDDRLAKSQVVSNGVGWALADDRPKR